MSILLGIQNFLHTFTYFQTETSVLGASKSTGTLGHPDKTLMDYYRVIAYVNISASTNKCKNTTYCSSGNNNFANNRFSH
jgi:hypothetical protein